MVIYFFKFPFTDRSFDSGVASLPRTSLTREYELL